MLNYIHGFQAKAETIKVDVRKRVSSLHMVEVCGMNKLGRFLNIEPPPSKEAHVESVEDAHLPSSTSSVLDSSVPSTSQQSLSVDSYPHTPKTSTAVPLSGSSPHVQVYVASITGVGTVVIGMESFWPCKAFLNLHINVCTKMFFVIGFTIDIDMGQFNLPHLKSCCCFNS